MLGKKQSTPVCHTPSQAPDSQDIRVTFPDHHLDPTPKVHCFSLREGKIRDASESGTQSENGKHRILTNLMKRAETSFFF
jgi:hypothetical protein